MTKSHYTALIKAELSALKDMEKAQKWMHITLRSAEERHAHKELTTQEMVLIQEVLRGQIVEAKAGELIILKRIASLAGRRDEEN